MKIYIARKPESCIQIQQEDAVITLTKSEAIDLAVWLVHETEGDMVGDYENGKVVTWNLKSTFLEAYRKLMETLA